MNPTITFPWTDTDIVELDSCRSFAEIGKILVRVILRHQSPVTMVSGPMTTGGRGTLEANLEAYAKAQRYLSRCGDTIFDQLTAQPAFGRIWHEWKRTAQPHEYCQILLDDAYLPVFKTGRVAKLVFIPGWATSEGCRWERLQAARLGIKIEDFAAL